MIKQSPRKRSRHVSSCSIATMLLFASLAFAKSYDILVDTNAVHATVIEQVQPVLPEDAELKKRQEGWVEIGFDISPAGKPDSPMILDSLGGEVFEQAALEALSDWSFSTPEERHVTGNILRISFKTGARKEEASRNFLRWYNMAARELMDKDLAGARERMELTKAQPDWSLYEHSLLEVLAGEIAAAEGREDLQLASLRRVVNINNETALNTRSQRKILKTIFELEMRLGELDAAESTLARLRDVKGSKKTLEALADDIEKLEAASDDIDEIASNRVRHVADDFAEYPAISS